MMRNARLLFSAGVLGLALAVLFTLPKDRSMTKSRRIVIIAPGALEPHKERVPNWDNVPEVLKYMIPYAKKYGSLRYDDVIWSYLDNCSNEEKLDILKMERKWTDEMGVAWEKFMKDFPMLEHEESSLFYFLGHFLALGHDTPGCLPKPTDDNIKKLQAKCLLGKE